MSQNMSSGAVSAFVGKKFILSAFVVVTFIIYSLSQRGASSGSAVVVAPSQSLTSTVAQPAPSQNAGSGSSPLPAKTPTTKTPAPAPTPVTAPKGQYTDGTYTGVSADAYYGNIQVSVTISGGKITDVVFLNYPQDRGTSRQINGQAMPYLKQEAIAAQNANVNIVSGATDSSLAFRQSLASALAQAKA